MRGRWNFTLSLNNAKNALYQRDRGTLEKEVISMSDFKIIESGNLLAWNVSNRTKTTGIVLHHAEADGCTVYDINRWHKNNGWAGI